MCECKTKKEKIAELYAKNRGWWDKTSDDFFDSDVRGDCFEFADDVMNIVFDGKP